MKSKVFSLINVFGLAVGLSAFFLIVQYVSFEMSYDQFHKNKDEIYRVGLERYKKNELQLASAKNFAGLRKLIRENFLDVNATGFYKTPANTGVFFKYQGKIFNELGGELNADSSFFKVFQSLLIKGDPATALDDPHSLVLSESMAKKIFGETEPLGQRIQRPNDSGNESECVITGIIKDLPENSHFHTNFIIPLVYSWGYQDEWKQDFLLTYVSLQKRVDPLKLSQRLNKMYEKMGEKFPEMRDTRSFLQPITSIHLSSNLKDEVEANGSQLQVYVAGFIGLIILVIAWINYINLETARFIMRAREVGVRRIVGSSKTDLAFQFLIEYFCVLVLAFALAVFFVALILPRFSNLTGIPITSIQWPQPNIWTISLAVLVAGSFLVGIYPAVFLMRLNPIASLKGNFGSHNRGGVTRKSLMIVQFCSSLILIGFVLVIHSQLNFMRFANKKFDVEQVIAIRNPTAYSNEEVSEKHNAYKLLENKLRANASIKMMTSSSAIPGTEIGFTYINLLKRNVNDPFDPTHFKTLFIDYNYIPFYGLKLLAGRNFDPPRQTKEWINLWEDEHWLTLILNESAIKALGFNSPEEAVDQIVEFENFEDHFQKHRIIGVVADYHHEAVKKEVFPMILSPNYGSFQQVYYSVRLHQGANPQRAIADVEKSWKEAFPEKPFDYFFLDDYYDRQFKSEVQTGRIFVVFAGIAIFIACLGILGMTLFEANSRLKEISIRKVLGASVTSLVALLSREHVKLIASSLLISVPIIYFSANEWLSHYPVRIEINGWFFLLPFLAIVIAVAFASGVQTYRTANSNPVDHLKHE